MGQLGLILHTVDGGASWARQTSGAVQELRAVAFSGGHVWAAGDGGTILHSRGGAAWEAQTAGLTKTLRGISFVDASNGWAVGGDVGNDMTILRTSTGGATWTAQQVTDGGTIFYAVSFADANNGWAAGGSGKVIHTGLSLSIRASVPIVLKNHSGGW